MGVFTIKTQKPTIFHFPHMLVTELIWAAGHCILNTIFCKMTDIQVSNSLLGWSGDEFSLLRLKQYKKKIGFANSALLPRKGNVQEEKHGKKKEE